jgi:hypothetical protein
VCKVTIGGNKSHGYNGSYTTLAQMLSIYPKDTNLKNLPPALKSINFSSRSLGITLCQSEEK